MKVRNLRANHNKRQALILLLLAVLASVKVRNLKANHNTEVSNMFERLAVLASVKVRNLEAHRNRGLFTTAHLVVMAIGCWSAYG